MAWLIPFGIHVYLSFIATTVPTGDQTVPYTERGSVRGYLTPSEHSLHTLTNVICIAEPIIFVATFHLWSAVTRTD